MKNFDHRTKEGFQEVIVSQIPNLLDDTIEWIRTKLEPGEVFPVGDLERWAETNGYVKEG